MAIHALVGCGGIGYHLAEAIARGLTRGDEMWFVDGDVIEEKNLERQFYPGVVGTGKARALKNIVSTRFPDVNTFVMDEYLNHSTVGMAEGVWLKDGVTVWGCVDNNATRVYLQNLGEKIDNIVLIVGGNDDTTGQAQAYVRRDSRNQTPKITEISPEILAHTDEIPSSEHCLERSVSEPQTALVNRAVALAMEVLYGLVTKGGKANEIRVDTQKGNMTAFTRPSLTKERRKK